MKLCIFEDRAVGWLEPLTLTRPAFDLRCGAATLLERQLRAFGADEAVAWVRPELAALCEMNHAYLRVNEPIEPCGEGVVLVNARWLALGEPIADLSTPRVGMVDNQVAYVILSAGRAGDVGHDTVENLIDGLRHELPACSAGGAMVNHLWELIDQNSTALSHDARHFAAANKPVPVSPDIRVMGPADRLLIADSAAVEPYVTFDTRHGPVLIDRGAVIQAFTRVAGPAYIGCDSAIVGGKLERCTIGPSCRVGGEVQDSIVQGFSNKYHDGFLGHSYLGEWVNVAAGTQFSDLRNDYGPVTVTLLGERVPTGRPKIGAFVGDHTKTGLCALVNTGSVIGAFCNLLPTGTYLPSVIPSFCQARGGTLRERTDLRSIFQTAATVMHRRGFELTDAHMDLYFTLYDQTSPRRRHLLQEAELRLLRQSV